MDWSRGFEVPVRKLLHVRTLAQLCQMQAALLFEEGRELEAVGVLLDALQLAGDMSQGPLLIEEMVGVSLLSTGALLEGVADGTLLDLSPAAAERLVAGVSALDRRLGWQVTSFEGELVRGARAFEPALQDENGLRDQPAGSMLAGMHLTRARLFAAEYVNTTRGFCATLERACAAGPSVLLEELEDFHAQVDALENPIAMLALPRFDSATRGRLYSLGRFRLLAQAISGVDPRLDPGLDPWLAEFLRAEETAAGTRLWLDHEIFDGLEIFVAYMPD